MVYEAISYIVVLFLKNKKKGGVGKTNFAFNLSCFLAIEKKKRILILDLNPQANLTQCFQLEVATSHAMDMFLKYEKILKR
ncbi:MAG: hypothetical protein PPFGHCPK_01464 (plasmid) [Spiroplasma endosymbiont of Drosophila atripex]|nr:MAG: hypothetical protein PPFGHCPK_01464 [Spiroplasma endosymbiont of Drosophila atripex]